MIGQDKKELASLSQQWDPRSTSHKLKLRERGSRECILAGHNTASNCSRSIFRRAHRLVHAQMGLACLSLSGLLSGDGELRERLLQARAVGSPICS